MVSPLINYSYFCVFLKIISGSNKLSKETVHSVRKLFQQISNLADTKSSVFVYSKDGTKYGNLCIVNHFLANHHINIYLGTSNNLKSYEITKLLDQLTNEFSINLDLHLGDFAHTRLNNKDAVDLSSSSKCPLNILHKKKTIVKFGGEENRIKPKKFENALRIYPYFAAGNSYDLSPLIIDWIKKIASNQELFENRVKGGKWNVGLGSDFMEYTTMAGPLSKFARDQENGEKERGELEKLCKFVATKPLDIIPKDNLQIQQTVKLFNRSPQMILDAMTKDEKLTPITVSTNKLEDVNKVFKGRQHLSKHTIREMSISDFVKSRKFKKEIEGICGSNIFDYSSFLEM